MNEAIRSIKKGKFVRKDDITITNILKDILENQEKNNIITESTMLRNKATAKIINKMKIATKPIQKVTAVEINKCLQELVNDYSNSYISKVHMQLNNVFNKAVLRKHLNENPFTIKGNIEKPRSIREDKKVEALTIEEHKLFLQQLEKQDYKHKDIFYILIRHRHESWRSLAD